MADRLHLFVVHEGDYGLSMTSPQLPGFVYGRATPQEFWADLPSALAFADAPKAPRVIHDVRRFLTKDGDEYTIRVAQDNFSGERARTAWLLGAVFGTEQSDDLMAGPRTVLGERQFVCVVPTDVMAWVIEQLDPRGDTLDLVLASGENQIVGAHISTPSFLTSDAVGTTAAMGLEPNATVQQFFETIPVNDRVLVSA